LRLHETLWWWKAVGKGVQTLRGGGGGLHGHGGHQRRWLLRLLLLLLLGHRQDELVFLRLVQRRPDTRDAEARTR